MNLPTKSFPEKVTTGLLLSHPSAWPVGFTLFNRADSLVDAAHWHPGRPVGATTTTNPTRPFPLPPFTTHPFFLCSFLSSSFCFPKLDEVPAYLCLNGQRPIRRCQPSRGRCRSTTALPGELGLFAPLNHVGLTTPRGAVSPCHNTSLVSRPRTNSDKVCFRLSGLIVFFVLRTWHAKHELSACRTTYDTRHRAPQPSDCEANRRAESTRPSEIFVATDSRNRTTRLDATSSGFIKCTTVVGCRTFDGRTKWNDHF